MSMTVHYNPVITCSFLVTLPYLLQIRIYKLRIRVKDLG